MCGQMRLGDGEQGGRSKNVVWSREKETVMIDNYNKKEP